MIKDYWQLTKPRVTQLAVFCAIIGMFLSTPAQYMPNFKIIIIASLGIWLMAAAAFAFNCIFEAKIDAKMSRTAWRITAINNNDKKNIKNKISHSKIILFALVLGLSGAYVLYFHVNHLTMWLTLATFFGYSFIYTLILKPNTPQNIVIGGLSGAMPPALGWAAVQNSLSPQAWMLVLIIFCWTPPHFWALSLYRIKDYAKSNLPMLPITHGKNFTCLHMLLYTYILAIVSIFPYLYGMSGILYLISSLILNSYFIFLVYKLHKYYSDILSKKIFKYSIIYLALLFLSLIIDHYVK